MKLQLRRAITFGSEVAHHIENRSDGDLKYLVFGERCAGDVVFYPEHRVMTVKALGWKRMTYREREAAKPSG